MTQSHLLNWDELGFVQEVTQNHEEMPRLHLRALASSHVTAALTFFRALSSLIGLCGVWQQPHGGSDVAVSLSLQGLGLDWL